MLESLNTYQEMIGEEVFFLYEDKITKGELFAINIEERGIAFNVHFVKENLQDPNEDITFYTNDISSTVNGMYIRAIQAYDKMIRSDFGEVEAKLKIKLPSKAVPIPIEAWIPEEIEGESKKKIYKVTSKRLTKSEWQGLLQRIYDGEINQVEASEQHDIKLPSLRTKYCVWKKNNFEL